MDSASGFPVWKPLRDFTLDREVQAQVYVWPFIKWFAHEVSLRFVSSRQQVGEEPFPVAESSCSGNVEVVGM
jgi:hypothetical protein